MNRYCVSVSIPNIYQEGQLFDKQFFFEGEFPPTKERVIEALTLENEECIKVAKCPDDEILDVLEVLKEVKNLPEVSSRFAYISLPTKFYEECDAYGSISIKKLKFHSTVN